MNSHTHTNQTNKNQNYIQMSQYTATEIHELLTRYNITKKTCTSNRRGFPARHRAITLGTTRGRFNGVVGLSYWSKKFPELYEKLFEYGAQICPHEFTSIHVNHNVQCPPHKDSSNQTQSTIISFGSYTGGELMIEDTKFNAWENPITFNGAEKTHWNLPHTGDKYSLVFF